MVIGLPITSRWMNFQTMLSSLNLSLELSVYTCNSCLLFPCSREGISNMSLAEFFLTPLFSPPSLFLVATCEITHVLCLSWAWALFSLPLSRSLIANDSISYLPLNTLHPIPLFLHLEAADLCAKLMETFDSILMPLIEFACYQFNKIFLLKIQIL